LRASNVRLLVRTPGRRALVMAGRHWRSDRHRLHALPFLFVLSAASSDACMRAARRWLPSARTSRPGSTNRHRWPPN